MWGSAKGVKCSSGSGFVVELIVPIVPTIMNNEITIISGMYFETDELFFRE